MTPGRGEHGCGHEQEQQGDEGLGVLPADMRADEQDQHHADGQAAERPAVGEHLHRRSQPQPADGGQDDDQDQDVIENVHVRAAQTLTESMREVPMGSEQRGGSLLAVAGLRRAVHRLG